MINKDKSAGKLMYCYIYPTGLQQSKIGTFIGTEKDFEK